MNMVDFLKDAEQDSSTADRDEAAMKAMGRRQLLNRNFGFVSMVGFTTTMMATWEAVCFGLAGGLLNGGPVALTYGFILCFVGTLFTCCSIAELASMYPTAGGQYHYVALLAPAKYKNILSWMAGWLSILAWVCTTVLYNLVLG
jgi:amino acid transporter